jgi:RNA polymerase sigma-70 factor (ECF subfamily)
LCDEAIRLARLIRILISPTVAAEATGLLALMLLHDARRNARVDAAGDIVVLEEQDRSLWNHAQIAEAVALVTEAFRGGAGAYALQAAIAAEHCRAIQASDTDWRRIVELYGALERIQPSPVIALNRAVAIAMAEGPRTGLVAMEQIAKSAELDNYHLLHAARADLLRRLGDDVAAAISYRRAISLATNGSERRYLERRLAQLRAS